MKTKGDRRERDKQKMEKARRAKQEHGGKSGVKGEEIRAKKRVKIKVKNNKVGESRDNEEEGVDQREVEARMATGGG